MEESKQEMKRYYEEVLRKLDEIVELLCDRISALKPFALLIPATSWGKLIAPRIAARLNLGLTGDCVGLSLDKENLVQWKPAYGGNILAERCRAILDVRVRGNDPQADVAWLAGRSIGPDNAIDHVAGFLHARRLRGRQSVLGGIPVDRVVLDKSGATVYSGARILRLVPGDYIIADLPAAIRQTTPMVMGIITGYCIVLNRARALMKTATVRI